MRERIRNLLQHKCCIQLPGLATGSLASQIPDLDAGARAYNLPTKIAHVNGTELHYFELGDGEPVIFVHGSTGDYRTWGYQFEAFAQRYRVISYSRRYHYPNVMNGSAADYTNAVHAADLAALIRHLGYGPAHIVGQSSGGEIVCYCARHFAEMVRTLIAVEPSLYGWLPELKGGQSLLDEWTTGLIEPSLKAISAEDHDTSLKILCDGVLGAGTWDNLSSEARGVMLDNAPAWKIELTSGDIRSPFSFDDARAIRAPTLVVQGGASKRIYGVIVDKVLECVPDVEVAHVADAPHPMHVVSPDQFNALVLNFIGRHSGSAGSQHQSSIEATRPSSV